ncbi:uncharacterized protein SCHCODRAFT_01090196 [Schizophyllum commune H4-8]|uniref:uncharacterized protein n=1 Tax=Schizophyllum commune (strain H4-8 / FGSC 9210) TaxID=578458 RepID=UPI00216001F6|nr:uncharacterized protein SCHCODRAFT_01090196 [Schizophyllum commune H4-8]KAI5894714.1 hypothetical protein SCHCODRAFT_01090196 [Schizophyllum commune H4-8]
MILTLKQSVLDALKPFICMHFSTFNRCGSRGDDAPTDIHPLLLRREGGRVNHHQFVPYVAKELKENYPVYRSLCESLERMFQWISMKIRQRLPDMHKELVMMAEVMPQSNPAYPFTGFVVNINVATKAHRDANDFHGCALIVLGEHQGGELCLYEPGLVLPLREGDLFVFPSGRITHFNLLYKGERGSIVCHSDRAGTSWMRSQNGWNGNVYCPRT